jgi:sulfite reductase beta subunit-like hemoprotein
MVAVTELEALSPPPAGRSVDDYRAVLARFTAGDCSAEMWEAFSASFGVHRDGGDDHGTVRVDIPGGIPSAAAARRLAGLATAHAAGRLFLTPEDGVQLRGVALEATPEVLEALPPPAAAAAEPVRDGRMAVTVAPPHGSLTSAQLERLAEIAAAYAFGGLCTIENGRLVLTGVDPTLVTAVVAETQAAGLAAEKARPRGE